MPHPVPALFYDCTHDNKTPAEMHMPEDALPQMILVSLTNCASATTFGYDILVPTNPSVVGENRLYVTNQAELLGVRRIKIGDGPVVLVDYMSINASSVEIRGSWNNTLSGSVK